MDSKERSGALEAAIAKDPSFAPAYASLAALYAIRSVQFPVDHPPDELATMTSLAEQAIRLDPLLPEAHDAMGLVHARNARWEQAEASFRRAIELDPNNVATYVHYVQWLLQVLDRHDDALKSLRIAETLDPLAPDVQANLGETLVAMGRRTEAARHCNKLSDGETFKIRCLARIQLRAGNPAEASRLLETDPRLPTQPLIRGTLGYA